MEHSFTQRFRMESSGVEPCPTREILEFLTLDFEESAITGLLVED
jgi:hypothetical protein